MHILNTSVKKLTFQIRMSRLQQKMARLMYMTKKHSLKRMKVNCHSNMRC